MAADVAAASSPGWAAGSHRVTQAPSPTPLVSSVKLISHEFGNALLLGYKCHDYMIGLLFININASIKLPASQLN